MTQVRGKLIGVEHPERVEITAALVDAAGRPVVGYVTDVEGEVVSRIQIHANGDGEWEADLPANSGITSARGDTLWQITEGRRPDGMPATTYISVPATGPWWLGELRVQVSGAPTGTSSVVYAPGPAGQSAYQLWLAAGNAGTVDDFLSSLSGAVDSVNGHTGTVVLTASSVGAEPAGASTAAQTAAASDATAKVQAHTAAIDPHGDRTYADTSKLAKNQNLADLPSASAARTALGLGTAATRAVGTASGTVAAGDDARLADARTPTVHKASHATGQADALAPGDIGAYTAATGTALEGRTTALEGGRLESTQNLADLDDPAAARTALGLGGAATRDVGTTGDTVAAGDDSRLNNPRTPTSHASTHAAAGSDPITPAAIGAYPATDGQTLNGYLDDILTRIGGTYGLENRATAVEGRATALESGKLDRSANLGDLASPASARTNLQLDTTYAPLASVWLPADHGLLGWTFDPAAAGIGATLSAGYIYLLAVNLRAAATISKVHAVISAAGSGLTSGQCLAGLYTAAGTRVGLTGDMSTTWNSAGNKAMSLTASYSAAAGRYYVALLFAGTTSPTVACGSTLGANFTPGNANLGAGGYRWCRSASGQTSLPSSITVSGYTPDANNVWAAVS